MSVDMERVSFVSRSEYRMHVLGSLDTHPATPSTLSNRTGIAITHVSRSLSELRERGLVELLVSEDVRKGRYYGITSTGEETLCDLRALEALPEEYQ